jgi:ribosome maturation factor RimP
LAIATVAGALSTALFQVEQVQGKGSWRLQICIRRYDGMSLQLLMN